MTIPPPLPLPRYLCAAAAAVGVSVCNATSRTPLTTPFQSTQLCTPPSVCTYVLQLLLWVSLSWVHPELCYPPQHLLTNTSV